MPFVFMGSFIGVKLGKAMPEMAQMILFGLTLIWSIYKTAKTAIKLQKEELALKTKEEIRQHDFE